MKEVALLDKTFELYIPQERIFAALDKLAVRVAEDYAGKKPVFVAVLTGAFMFASDFLKRLDILCEVTFLRVKSYEGTSTTGEVTQVLGLGQSVKGRDVVILEDIVDTGYTMRYVIDYLNGEGAASVQICTMFYKPKALLCQLEVKYPAMIIPNDFIVGYGLDYDGYGRNLPEVYKLKS